MRWLFFWLTLVLAVPPRSAWPGEPAGRVTMPAAKVEARLRPRIVLMQMGQNFPGETWQAVERQTKGELSSLGLSVISVPAVAEDVPSRVAELRKRAEQHRAIGTLRIERRAGAHRVQLWVYDALTRKTVVHDTTVADEGGQDATAVVALRMVGLLHASLLELRMRGRGTLEPPPEAPPLVEQLVSRRLDPPAPGPARARIWGGPALATIALEEGLTPLFRLGAAWRIRSALLLGIEAALPFSSGRIDPDDGRGAVSVLPLALQALAVAEPWPSAMLSPALALGVGALLIRAEGQATSASRSLVDWSVSTLLSARLELAIRASHSLDLVPYAAVGFAAPTVAVYFDEEVVKRLGKALLEGGFSVRWSWR